VRVAKPVNGGTPSISSAARLARKNVAANVPRFSCRQFEATVAHRPSPRCNPRFPQGIPVQGSRTRVAAPIGSASVPPPHGRLGGTEPL
jgi:hypothetical protein